VGERLGSNFIKLIMRINFIDAGVDDIDCMINMIKSEPGIFKNNPYNLDKTKDPWIWISDKLVTFKLILIDKAVCGFFIARHINANSHLHGFFIKKSFRNKGLGKMLIFEFLKSAFKINPNIQTLTLHVYSTNINAIKFYKKYNFREIEQTNDLIFDSGGYGSWARNCSIKGRWPLNDGVMLFGIGSIKAMSMIKR